MGFTDNQNRAKDLRGSNILVSAAAGSGKTAVLVERILERVTADPKDPDHIDIDRMLVMTFTKAAARQMRERLLGRIEEKRLEKPGDDNLAKQAILIHNSNITTIDSFCLDVVKNHFSEIDIDPDFRIADEGEVTLIKQDVLEELLEKEYEKADEDFMAMIETFSGNKNDSSIEKIILELHKFAESYPEPDLWLDQCGDIYKCKTVEEVDNSKWLSYITRDAQVMVEVAMAKAEEALRICNMENGPAGISDTIDKDIEFIYNFRGIRDYSKLYKVITECNESKKGFPTLRKGKYKEGELENDPGAEEKIRKQDEVLILREEYKKIINDLKKEMTKFSSQDILDSLLTMSPVANAVINVTKEFSKAYIKKKREKNISDFSEIEHLCLKILRDGKDTTAKEYRDYFKEIYVDEYQDSNFVQEAIVNLIKNETDTSGNVFMVGDVKQSIYGFRLARPKLFIDKYDSFKEDGRDIRVDLSDNFRSRSEVIDCVNDIFSVIMSKEFGDIEYDDKAALHRGAVYPEGEGYKAEYLLALESESIPKKELEAIMIADRIEELMKTQMVREKDQLRKIKYSDIVILLRATKDYDNVFAKVLEGRGIPVHVTASKGYFSAQCVSDLLSFLRVIDNPMLDIDLAQVLRSPLGGFDDNDLGIIRGTFKSGRLYNAIKEFEITYDEDDEDELMGSVSGKISRFLKDLEYYRNKAEYSSAYELLSEVIDGEYGRIIRSMPLGKKRMANLNMLLSKALEYGNTSFKGLFHFNRYIEALKKYDIDFGEANVIDEADDTVRIMTIHKSKGLEFPVCFLAGMNKNFNKLDFNNEVLCDSDFGIAMNLVDYKRRFKEPSVIKNAFKIKKNIDLIAEEMRLFYVALTRAEEKIIMTGVTKEDPNKPAKAKHISKCLNYLDFYKVAVAYYESAIPSVDFKYVSENDMTLSALSRKMDGSIQAEQLKNALSGKITGLNEDVVELLKNRFSFSYEYKYSENADRRVSVSELKKKGRTITMDEDTDHVDDTVNHFGNKELVEIVPSFIKESEINYGATHGSAIHRVLEIWDYNLSEDYETVEKFMKEAKEKYLLEEGFYNCIKPGEIVSFLKSDIARRMKDAFKRGELVREQPFVLGVPADVYYTFENLSEEDKLKVDVINIDNAMYIQGIIDAYFIEDGKIVVVDYKTDKKTTDEEFIKDYKVQLDYYALALHRLTGMDIKEKIIYSTRLKKTIIL